MTPPSAVAWPSPWRMLALFATLGLTAPWWGAPLAEALFPLWWTELGLLDGHWRADRLWIDHEGADRVIRASIGLQGCLRLPDRLVCDPAQPIGNASTLLGHVTLTTALLVSTALGWPLGGRRLVRRAIGLGPALLLLWMLDVPLALGAAFAQPWREAVVPGSGTLLLAWGEFLQSGGRLALALLLAALAVLVAGPAQA